VDGQRFDHLAKSLVRKTTSRREALRRFGGGLLAAATGSLALEEASAQSVGIEEYDMTCRQPGTKFYCTAGTSANEVTTCKSSASGCVCAQKREGGAVCVEQAQGNCPTRRNKCDHSRDCGSGRACIRVSACCSGSNRGKCVRRCPA
jgi:hypothetical protein